MADSVKHGDASNLLFNHLRHDLALTNLAITIDHKFKAFMTVTVRMIQIKC